MRSLNEIISRNAKKALADAIRDAKREGLRLTKADVARRMSELMTRSSSGTERESFDPKTVYRTLNWFFANKRLWRTDYLQAFADAVGRPASRLVNPDYDGARVSEATYTQLLVAGVGHRLNDSEARRIVRNLNRELDNGVYDLVAGIAESIIDAPSKADALLAVSDLIQKSEAWSSKAASHKASTRRDHKS